jgi:nucleoside diphosphate kinase
MERTLVMLKPDSVERRLLGQILARFEDKGLRVVGLKMIQMDRALAERFYAEHQGRDFRGRRRSASCAPCWARPRVRRRRRGRSAATSASAPG